MAQTSRTAANRPNERESLSREDLDSRLDEMRRIREASSRVSTSAHPRRRGDDDYSHGGGAASPPPRNYANDEPSSSDAKKRAAAAKKAVIPKPIRPSIHHSVGTVAGTSVENGETPIPFAEPNGDHINSIGIPGYERFDFDGNGDDDKNNDDIDNGWNDVPRPPPPPRAEQPPIAIEEDTSWMDDEEPGGMGGGVPARPGDAPIAADDPDILRARAMADAARLARDDPDGLDDDEDGKAAAVPRVDEESKWRAYYPAEFQGANIADLQPKHREFEVKANLRLPKYCFMCDVNIQRAIGGASNTPAANTSKMQELIWQITHMKPLSSASLDVQDFYLRSIVPSIITHEDNLAQARRGGRYGIGIDTSKEWAPSVPRVLLAAPPAPPIGVRPVPAPPPKHTAEPKLIDLAQLIGTRYWSLSCIAEHLNGKHTVEPRAILERVLREQSVTSDFLQRRSIYQQHSDDHSRVRMDTRTGRYELALQSQLVKNALALEALLVRRRH